MGKYSIKDLERLSGIKAHTIRIWEKRYEIVKPQRTPTNIRYYSDEDLKKILNIALLNQAGHKISNIAGLSPDELRQKIEEYAVVKDDVKYFLDNLVFATVDMDEARFERLFDQAILDYGMEKTMLQIIYPFFKNVGLMWLTGALNPGQEHYISNIVRRKLIVAIDKREERNRSGDNVILFLPEGEWHELGLLFFHYVCLGMDVKSYYLGQSVPLESIKQIVIAKDPSYLVFSHLSIRNKTNFKKYLTRLTEISGNSELVFIDRPGNKNQALNDFDIYNPTEIEEFKQLIMR
ncbi:MAG: MerR family transcriptional regulator [Bacteroidota bacterium]